MTFALPDCPVVFTAVPHYGLDERSNRWLQQCIESLLAQTVPLQAIIVVDDQSPCSPEPVVRRYPSVSLLRNATNTGPFAILDHVLSHVSADALLFQDSDDWSTPDRLHVLLAAMRKWNAGMVGCQVHCVYENPELDHGSDSAPLPHEPRAALLEKPTLHSLLLPSALISCAFAREIGGFSSGLKFGADSEFVRRAIFGGEVRNVAETGYFRRIHARSLTQAAATGFGSSARLAVQQRVQEHARALVKSYREGGAIDLAPLVRAPPTRFVHVLGPSVAGL
jgi:glycosyltransferase involved in cell wall biosynthesis